MLPICSQAVLPWARPPPTSAVEVEELAQGRSDEPDEPGDEVLGHLIELHATAVRCRGDRYGYDFLLSGWVDLVVVCSCLTLDGGVQ